MGETFSDMLVLEDLITILYFHLNYFDENLWCNNNHLYRHILGILGLKTSNVLNEIWFTNYQYI